MKETLEKKTEVETAYQALKANYSNTIDDVQAEVASVIAEKDRKIQEQKERLIELENQSMSMKENANPNTNELIRRKEIELNKEKK